MSEREGLKAQSEPTAEELAHQPEAHAVRRKYLLIAVAVLAVLIVAAVAAWLFFGPSKSGAGRVVTAPRNISLEQPGAGSPAPPAEQTLTLAPEMVSRAGIKIEAVGEQLMGDSTGGQTATGVVRENAYRTTPVVSLVGGIVRRVNAELGASVRRGQPLAVVFSNELAMAQSSYLGALADLEEHHKHHRSYR